jgi:hypothetical protein
MTASGQTRNIAVDRTNVSFTSERQTERGIRCEVQVVPISAVSMCSSVRVQKLNDHRVGAVEEREGEVIAMSRAIGPVVRYQSYTPGADA